MMWTTNCRFARWFEGRLRLRTMQRGASWCLQVNVASAIDAVVDPVLLDSADRPYRVRSDTGGVP
ncbi:hypothetical protein A2J03_17180 [Rhodococcus sp. EPR-157]|nr:hypothetical protein A2J03_17180 [Rhodococcus sp. EPR-157]